MNVDAVKMALADVQAQIDKFATNSLGKIRLDNEKAGWDKWKKEAMPATQEVGSALKGLATGAVAELGVALGGVFAVSKIKAWVSESVAAFAEAETAAVRLELAIRNAGSGNGAAFDKQQSGLMGGRFSDENVAAAQQATLKFGKITDDMRLKIVALSKDMANMDGGTMESAAEKVSRAMESPAQGLRLLKQYGVILTEQQKDAIQYLEKTGDVGRAQQFIFDELQKKVKGSSEAIGNTLEGRWDNIKTKMGEVAEKVGGMLAPALQQALEILDRMTTKFNQAADGWAALFNAMRGGPNNNEKIKRELDAMTAKSAANDARETTLGDIDQKRIAADGEEAIAADLEKIAKTSLNKGAAMAMQAEAKARRANASRLRQEAGKLEDSLGDPLATDELDQEIRKFRMDPANGAGLDARGNPIGEGAFNLKNAAIRDARTQRDFQLSQQAGAMLVKEREERKAAHEKSAMGGAEWENKKRSDMVADADSELAKKQQLSAAIISATTPYALERARKAYNDEFGGNGAALIQNVQTHQSRIESLDSLHQRITQAAASKGEEEIRKAIDRNNDTLKQIRDKVVNGGLGP